MFFFVLVLLAVFVYLLFFVQCSINNLSHNDHYRAFEYGLILCAFLSYV